MDIRGKRIFAVLLTLLFAAFPLTVFASSPYWIEAIGPTEMQTDEAFIEIMVEDLAGSGWRQITATTTYDGALYDLTEVMREYGRVAIRITGNTDVVIKVTAPDGKVYSDSRRAYVFAQSTPTPTPAPQPAPKQEESVSSVVSNTSGQIVQNPEEDVQAEEPAPDATEEELPDAGGVPAMNTEGTSTVIDNAVVDGADREFFTVSTPLGNVFYLIIDRNKDNNNVFFLNAVTERDLMALAEGESWTKEVETSTPAPTAPDEADAVSTDGEPAAESEPAPKEGGVSPMILVAAVVVLGGGAGWYFKIYRPKQLQSDDDGEEYNGDESIPYGDDVYADDGWSDTEPEDDSSP